VTALSPLPPRLPLFPLSLLPERTRHRTREGDFSSSAPLQCPQIHRAETNGELAMNQPVCPADWVLSPSCLKKMVGPRRRSGLEFFFLWKRREKNQESLASHCTLSSGTFQGTPALPSWPKDESESQQLSWSWLQAGSPLPSPGHCSLQPPPPSTQSKGSGSLLRSDKMARFQMGAGSDCHSSLEPPKVYLPSPIHLASIWFRSSFIHLGAQVTAPNTSPGLLPCALLPSATPAVP
jgi:hypothetical protein